MNPSSILGALQLGPGEALLVTVTVALIFMPSVVPALGNAAGRIADRLRGRTPEP
jgi:Sec-independent protein translocase protein TatA